MFDLSKQITAGPRPVLPTGPIQNVISQFPATDLLIGEDDLRNYGGDAGNLLQILSSFNNPKGLNTNTTISPKVRSADQKRDEYVLGIYQPEFYGEVYLDQVHKTTQEPNSLDTMQADLIFDIKEREDPGDHMMDALVPEEFKNIDVPHVAHSADQDYKNGSIEGETAFNFTAGQRRDDSELASTRPERKHPEATPAELPKEKVLAALVRLGYVDIDKLPAKHMTEKLLEELESFMPMYSTVEPEETDEPLLDILDNIRVERHGQENGASELLSHEGQVEAGTLNEDALTSLEQDATTLSEEAEMEERLEKRKMMLKAMMRPKSMYDVPRVLKQGNDFLPDEVTEAKREAQGVTEAQHDAQDATEAQHDAQDVTEAQHDAQDATEAQHDAQDATEAQHDAQVATEAQHDAQVATEAQHDAQVATEAQHDAQVATEAQHDAQVATEAQHGAQDATEAQHDAQVATEAQHDAQVATEAQHEAQVAAIIKAAELKRIEDQEEENERREELMEVVRDVLGDLVHEIAPNLTTFAPVTTSMSTTSSVATISKEPRAILRGARPYEF